MTFSITAVIEVRSRAMISSLTEGVRSCQFARASRSAASSRPILCQPSGFVP